jgi:hypothetical protein
MATTTAKNFMASRSDLFGASPEKAAEYEALTKKLNEEARDNWDNPAWHRAVAQDLADTLEYGFTFENLFSTYFQTKNVGEFDRVALKERRGLKVYYTARGGYIDETQLRSEEWELPRDTLGFHVSEMTDKLRAGFATTMSDIVGLAGARLEAEVNRRIFNMLQAAVPSAAPNYVATVGMTQTQTNDAIIEVRDAIKPNGVGPIPVTIIGRAAMINKVSNFNLGFDPEGTAEIRAKGRLGVYRGANVVEVINYTDEDGAAYIPANELWVFGGTVGQFATYGSLQVKSWEENTVDYTHYRARKDIGGLVHHPEQAVRIVDSTVTA